MSIDPPLAPQGPDADDAAATIRRQAAEIVEAVLSRTAPEHAAVRDKLREHLAANPGHPEVALAEHLSSLGSLETYTASVQDVRHPAAQPDRTEEYEPTGLEEAESA